MSRSMTGVCVETQSSTRSPHATCPAGLGLDIGVLDEGGLEAAFSRHGRARERRFGIAALDPALDQAVILHIVVDQRRARRLSLT